MNSKGDKGTLFLKPCEPLKKPAGVPFTKREKCTKEIQCFIQLHNFFPKPHLLSIYNEISQFTWSNAFSIFNLQSTLGSLDLILLLRHSLAMRTKCRICPHLMKAFWGLEIFFSATIDKERRGWNWNFFRTNL